MIKPTSVGEITIFQLIYDHEINIGDKIKDQQGNTWEIIKKTDDLFDKYECKLICLERGNTK